MVEARHTPLNLRGWTDRFDGKCNMMCGWRPTYSGCKTGDGKLPVEVTGIVTSNGPLHRKIVESLGRLSSA